MTPRKLNIICVEKPWGVEQLPSQFTLPADSQIGEIWCDGKIGEIWFEPPATQKLLAKYIFTSERLSIQVHPNDEQAKARGLQVGKEECWYIIDTAPDAVLGIGTRNMLSGAELADAAFSGEIENLMEWHAVKPNMFFYIPAGTVHAIGGGVSLVEIQQNSDVTYRLYDYGRPRELHLEDGAAVAEAQPMPPELRQIIDPHLSAKLLETSHFEVVHVAAGDLEPLAAARGDVMIIPLEGTVRAGDVVGTVGDCLYTDDPSTIRADGRFLAAWERVS